MPKMRTTMRLGLDGQVCVSNEIRGLREPRIKYVLPSEIEQLGDMNLTNTLRHCMRNPCRDFVVSRSVGVFA